MRDTVLITGGAGFIGSNLALKLVRIGYRVKVLDLLTRQVHGPDRNSTTKRAVESVAELIVGDICDRNTLVSALQDVTAVVHFAAETGTGQSMYEIGKYADANVVGTCMLLEELSRKQGVSRLLVASSRAIYGEGTYHCTNHGPVYPSQRRESDMQSGQFEPRCTECDQIVQLCATDENSRLHPVSVYGITKQTQEQLLLLWGSTMGVPAIALRYQNVYGPGQSLTNPYTGILSIFSTRFLSGGDVNIFEDGKESRDFVYVDDVVEATISALKAPSTVSGAFNIGSGEPVDVLTVATLLRQQFGTGGEIRVTGNYRIGDIRHNFADIRRARKLLGWEPKVHFRDGINNFVQWVQEQQIGTDNYERSLDELKSRGMLK